MTNVRHRRILCVCTLRPGQTSGYRLQSLRRICPDVIAFDFSAYRSKFHYLASATSRLPVGPFIYRVNRDLLRLVRRVKPEVVWFDKPVQFTRDTILTIKQTGAQTVCYNQDNPFGPRKDPGWYQFRRVFRLFDLHCLFRDADIPRYQGWGLPWIRTTLSFEPTVHFPPPSGWSDTERSRSVSYIGSPYEERPGFLVGLGEDKNIPVAIAGPRWQKYLTPERYRRFVTSDYLVETAYREAIWDSRINLSFVTHSNEEDIGHKSVEIAACQGFLLALRTPGHQACFEEDREAVFFSDVEECADKCRFYLERPLLREEIARRGRERAVRSGYDNDTQIARILNRLDGRLESDASSG
ncbi:MAG: glycosyltransferase [Acidobacteriaceae bacterium]